MIVQFAKWGNSLAIRIPNAFAREIDAAEGGAADITIQDGRLVITPVEEAPTYDLDELVAGITDENRHAEIDTGTPVGNEFR